MTIQNEVPVPAEQEGTDLATRDDPRYGPEPRARGTCPD